MSIWKHTTTCSIVAFDPNKKKGGSKMQKQYMSIKEASEFSGLSKWTLYAYSARGKLKVLKVGTRTLVPVKSFTEWLESHERANTNKEVNDEG